MPGYITTAYLFIFTAIYENGLTQGCHYWSRVWAQKVAQSGVDEATSYPTPPQNTMPSSGKFILFCEIFQHKPKYHGKNLILLLFNTVQPCTKQISLLHQLSARLVLTASYSTRSPCPYGISCKYHHICSYCSGPHPVLSCLAKPAHQV